MPENRPSAGKIAFLRTPGKGRTGTTVDRTKKGEAKKGKRQMIVIQSNMCYHFNVAKSDKSEAVEEVRNMERYIALLRGINISGKNKVSMAELKQGFEKRNYTEVKTYLNSGNVIFSSDETDTSKLTSRIEEMINDQFRLDIPVYVISKEKLEDILLHAPDWWGDESKEIYDNLRAYPEFIDAQG